MLSIDRIVSVPSAAPTESTVVAMAAPAIVAAFMPLDMPPPVLAPNASTAPLALPNSRTSGPMSAPIWIAMSPTTFATLRVLH